jgi:SAM-dependent methyltransferase
MFLGGAKFVRIQECLYLYRVHSENTTSTKNAAIRDATMGVYNKNVWKLAEKWSTDSKLALVDLCGGVGAPPGYIPIDRVLPARSRGIVCDLDEQWDLADSSVGLLRAHDAVEHLKDPVHTMNEAYRVLASGGWLMVDVPSTNGLGAFSDPTHVSFWNKLSFAYYTDPSVSKYLHAYQGKFQVSRIIEWFPTAWHRENNVPYVEAHLISCKDGFRAMGEYLWADGVGAISTDGSVSKS